MNSTKNTKAHIKLVNDLMGWYCDMLLQRAVNHDKSKLTEHEKPYFDNAMRLKDLTYGSDEYKEQLNQLQPALEHHYKNNSHHPEYHANGIDDMTLLDVSEMFIDWLAAVKRHKDGDIMKSIEINKNRFNMSDQLVNIFKNTAKLLSKL